MKLFSCIFLLFISSIVFSQTTAIPDPNFEQYLIDIGADSGVPDGVVLTQNISTTTHLYINDRNISNLSGIEDFISLQMLVCYNNALSSLILQNPQLKYLYCDYNQLTVLDIANCSLLEEINCTSNNLTSLNVTNQPNLKKLHFTLNHINSIDLTQNPLLTDLYANANLLSNIDIHNNTILKIINVDRNNITSIDVSNNLELIDFSCSNNSLNSLDLSNNNKLTQIDLLSNDLYSLNLKNINLRNLGLIIVRENTNLSCVELDDPYLALNKFKIDSLCFDFQVQFSKHCGTNQIIGNVYFDENDNCIKELSDIPLNNIFLKASNGNDTYCNTDINGNYRFFVDSNQTYHIELIESNTQIESYCEPNGIDVQSGPSYAISASNNIGVDLGDFELPTVSISQNRMRRCFTNNATITYKNEGTLDVTNAEVFVDFPEFVTLLSASELFTTINEEQGIYKFNIPIIEAFGEGRIYIVDSVNCWNEDIRGYTQCIKTWITPKSTAAEIKDTTNWDKSSIVVEDNVACIGDSIARFTFQNHGDGDMASSHEYRVFYDNELAYSNTFQLNSGESISLDVTADGSTIRLEADQHPLHPGRSRPRTTIEGCGSPIPADASLGFWPQAPHDDLDYDISEVCLEIRDSYDPNDKSVYPSGITEHNFVPEQEPLHYTIQFQNTGSDDAYNIIVVDTLSQQLDLSSLQVTSASHNYTYSVSGDANPVLQFTFANINLPDSTTNEAQSHGFISFTISPILGIIPGTEIENFADIYFDYNSAIRTNTVRVIAKDTIIESTKSITVTEANTSIVSVLSNIQISPNPFANTIVITGIDILGNNLSIKNIVGVEVMQQKIQSNNTNINVNSLETGCYFITITNYKGESKVYKMVKK